MVDGSPIGGLQLGNSVQEPQFFVRNSPGGISEVFGERLREGFGAPIAAPQSDKADKLLRRTEKERASL